jgi:hypothetical protein
MVAGDAAKKIKEPAGLEQQATAANAIETTAKDPSSAQPSETANDINKHETSASNGQASNGSGELKAATAGTDKSGPAGTQQGMQPNRIPSKPYQVPAGLSDLGRRIYADLKSVLDGPADKVGETLLNTPFCESTGKNTRRVDTRVMFALHQLLQETLKANPESSVEVFKRMLAIKMMVNRPDDPAFASTPRITCTRGFRTSVA